MLEQTIRADRGFWNTRYELGPQRVGPQPFAFAYLHISIDKHSRKMENRTRGILKEDGHGLSDLHSSLDQFNFNFIFCVIIESHIEPTQVFSLVLRALLFMVHRSLNFHAPQPHPSTIAH